MPIDRLTRTNAGYDFIQSPERSRAESLTWRLFGKGGIRAVDGRFHAQQQVPGEQVAGARSGAGRNVA